MADASTGGLDQAGIMTILERLGLGQFANGGNGGQGNFQPLSAETVDGQLASFDPGTVNLSGGRHFTDQQLMEGLVPPTSTGNNSGIPTSMMWSGGGNGQQQPQQNPYWWPKSNSELKAYYSEQNAFLKDQADSISKLLGGLNTQSSTAAPAINLGTQLSTAAPPNVAPVVNGPSGGFIDPTKSFLPGMGQNSAPAPGSLPSLTASPSAASLAQTQGLINQQNQLPSLASKLQQGNIQPSDILRAGGPLMASLTIPQNQGAYPAYTPTATATGLPATAAALPAAPVATAPAIGNDLGNLTTGLTKAYQNYQNRAGIQSDISLRSYAPATAQGGSISANPAGYNNPGNVFVNQPGQPTVAYPDATATNINGGTVVNNSATGTSTAVPDATASGAGMAGGAGITAGKGSALASGIAAIGKALMPQTITNTAQSRINSALLPKAPVITAPVMTGMRIT
jgi:hypothetical protein